MRIGVPAAAGLAALVVAGIAAAAYPPEQPVRATPAIELGGVVDRAPDGRRVLVWTEARRRRMFAGFDAYVKVGNAEAVRLGGARFSGGGGVDWPWIAYYRWSGASTDIRLYNAVTGVRRDAPAQVNTSDWEDQPTLSGDWLLFTRKVVDRTNSIVNERVVLHNGVTHEERVLDEIGDFEAGTVWAGQVAGDFAVWARSGRWRWRAFRYTISTGETVELAAPTTVPRRSQWAPSVTSDGVVYVARDGRRCAGRGVRIVRYFGSGNPQTGRKVAELGRGRDVSMTYARARGGDSAAIVYDRRDCEWQPRRWPPTDVYKIVVGR